ncbi:hypothetical protein [Streptomyces novaecaesareae]|uniref:hypothetical protein n=1 Tax=Streptomyces novaecaesareae TaxID=68244 RepID=UPI000A4B0631|nr:hypothetical protein [Streptomyces novaecaesareae]
MWLSVDGESTSKVLARCAGLPLALCIAAGPPRKPPRLDRRHARRRLVDYAHTLDELRVDDLAVRAGFHGRLAE